MNLRSNKNNRFRTSITIALCIFLITISTTMIVTSSKTFPIESEKPVCETLIPKNLNDKTRPMNYSFSFKEPNIQETKLHDIPFSKIHLPGTINIGRKAGEPAVPIKFVKLLLPPKKQVKNINVAGKPIEIKTNQINLKDKPIVPYQNPVPIGSPAPMDFKFNNKAYTSLDMYPSKMCERQHIGYCRGYTILSVALNPVQYIPGEGKLSYYPEMTIEIELKETGHVDQFYRNNPDDETWVKKLVYNPEMTECYKKMDMPKTEYLGGLCDPSDNYDYVIITREALFDFSGPEIAYNWTDLINRKKADGLEATKVKVEDILACSDYWNTTDLLFNDTAAIIREFCKDAYQDWGTQYILIGGDQDGGNAIERRLMDYEDESDVESDLYWSNLHNTFNADHDDDWGEEGDDGFDLFSELFIGSIPCDEPLDVSNWLTKSFYYAQSVDFDYLENAAFYGGDTGWLCEGDDFIDYSAIKGTDDWLGPDPGEHGSYPGWLGFQYGFETWNNENPEMEYDLSVKWTAEPPNPGWQGGSFTTAITGMRNAINDDQVTLISAVAHADVHMSMDVCDTEWESDYYNTKPFFIHDFGCHCGDMDAADDGVLHSMLFHSDTELAFACVYNTGYGWGSFYDTNSSSALQQKSFWDYLFDTTNKSGGSQNWQLGKAMAFSKDEMAPTIDWTYDEAPGSWRGTIQSCLLFGDPAQCIKPPELPEHNVGVASLDIPSHVKSNETMDIDATIVNNGKNDEVDVIVNLSVNGEHINSTGIPLFKNQTTEDMSFVWKPPTADLYTVTINVTIPGIIEDSYADNEKSQTIMAGILNIDTGELFNTIQEAIDDTDTMNGHGILVPNGIYYENVMINKSISLTGVDQNSTIIDGVGSSDSVIHVLNNSFVNITKFTLCNGTHGVQVESSSKTAIKESTICSNIGKGIYLKSSDNISITDNTIINNAWGIHITDSSSNTIIMDNEINGNDEGIILHNTSSNIVTDNNIINNNVGLLVGSGSYDNLIYHNNFNNTLNAFDTGSENQWDNGYYVGFRLSGGNWWSEYNSSDYFSGPGQNRSGSDGIGDTPYNIAGGNSQDQYPLMNPWTGPLPGTIFVDDDNANGPWDGTLEHPYQHIQDAINDADATDGDTVFVYNGTYYENIEVTKSLNITGENKDTTIIDGSGRGDVVSLFADEAEIHRFTIQNSISYRNGIYGRSDYTNISENTIINNGNGIMFIGSSYNIISDNIVKNNNNHGIYLDLESQDNDIKHCNVNNNTYAGIHLCELSTNCNIVNCTVYNNDFGIYPLGSANSNIVNCTVYNNSFYGIFLDCSPNCCLRSNTIYSNAYNFCIYGWIESYYHDIDTSNMINGKPIVYLVEQNNIAFDETDNIGYLGLASCTNVSVKNLDVEGVSLVETTHSTLSNVSSHDCTDGICLMASSNVTITNVRSYNCFDGIFLMASQNNVITDCTSYNNDYDGIQFLYGSSDCNIQNCTFYNNSRYGIYFSSSYANNPSDNNLIHHNNFLNNAINAKDSCSNMWDDGSEGNYWEDYNGTDNDSDGIGDTPYDILGGSNQDRYPLMCPWSGVSGDLDGDGDVDLSDLAQLLAHYGTPSGATYWMGDLDSDGDIDLSDLAALLANYGSGT